MEEDTEYKNLPVEDRCIHKLWKARIDGYDECIKTFEAITDEKSPELRKYEVLMKKFATDSNAVALDRALDAVLAFIINAHVSPRTVADVTAGLVTKALAAPKKTTQDKAGNIILMCVEVEKYEAVQEELMKGFTHKNPKVGAACLRTMTLALREFGNKVISIKLLIKLICPLLENRDKNIREETKKMVVEMYRWVRGALKPQLASLKPLQLQEMEAEFEKMGNEKAAPLRLLRTQQERQANIEEGELEAENEEDVDESNDAGRIDPLDLVEEVNILDQLPKDFYDKIEAKKWQDRKEALDAVFVLSQNAKLASGSYGDLVKALKKVIGKDSNVLLVTLAGNCIAGIAKGLRRDFSTYALSCIDTILNKFKEKKPNVVLAMREAVDAVYQSTSIEAIAETVIGVFASKNPNVKAETSSFLARSFCYCTHLMLNKKLIKTYATELLKALNESDPLVRAASAEALGTIFKIVGEKVMDPFLVDIDELKKKKVKEYSEKADIKVKAPVVKAKPVSKSAAASKAKKPVTRRPVSAKPAPKEIEEVPIEAAKDEFLDQDDELMDEIDCPESARNPVKAVRGRGAPLRGQPTRGIPAKKGLRPTSATRATTATAQKEKDDQGGPLLQVNVMKQARMKDEQKLKTIRWDFATPRPDFITQLKDQLEVANAGAQFITQLFHKDFKFHIKAIESLQKDLSNNLDACIANLDLILRWFTIRFFETNPSVILKAMEYLKQVFTLLTGNNYTLLDYEAYSFVPYLLSKFGDPKDIVRLSAQNIVSLICNIYPVNKISSFILEGLKSKNARQRAVCLETLGSLIENYGMTVCQPTPAVYLREVAKQISDRDNSVRNAALNALVQVYYREGEKVYKYIGTLSAKDMSLLEERIKRSSKNRPTIKKPSTEPQTQVVRPSESSFSVNNVKEIRGARVVPTLAQPPPNLRNKQKNSTLENENSCSSRLQIDYDFLTKLLYDDVENGNQTNKCNVQLEHVEDIDFGLEDDAFQRISSRVAKSNFSHAKYSTNHNVDDVSKVINSVIAQVADPDVETVIAALSQLDELMKSDEKRVHLYDHIDQLLIMMSLQFRLVHNTKMADTYPNKEECIRVYRSLIHCLLSIFQRDELATRATRDSLYDVVHVILSIIIDTRLTQIEDGPQIIKSLNFLVVRMIENANFTNIFSAQLKLLHESVGHSLNGKLIELAMKCNWKTIRTLNARSKELDVAVILLDLHNFWVAYPSHTWTDKTEKKPLSTIRTILHNMIDIYGNDILKYVSKIPNYQGSELQKYIHKTLKAAQKASKDESNGPKAGNKVSLKADQMPSSKTSGKRLSKLENEALSEIFKKIGSKENKQEGLQQLYEFKEKHKDADIESCMKKSSPFFQTYIERGLKKVEMEKQKSPTTLGASPEAQLSTMGMGDPAKMNIHNLVDDFKALAQHAGFDNTYIQAAVTDIYKNKTDENAEV